MIREFETVITADVALRRILTYYEKNTPKRNELVRIFTAISIGDPIYTKQLDADERYMTLFNSEVGGYLTAHPEKVTVAFTDAFYTINTYPSQIILRYLKIIGEPGSARGFDLYFPRNVGRRLLKELGF